MSTPSAEDYREIRKLNERRYRAEVALARHSVSHFVPLVLRDEQTGKPIRQAPIHDSWHRLLDKHDRAVIWSHIESGKTQQITIGRTLWTLGKNPNARIVIVSNTYGQAEKIVRAIARYIERSQELHDVFPKLRPGGTWSSTQLTVQRLVHSKDPSVQAIGVHGNILGARSDLIILDDLLDWENTRTDKLRKDLWNWYVATLAGRTVESGMVHCVGTAFHPEDFLHTFARMVVQRNGQSAAARYPVIDDVTHQSRWPERWSLKRIDEKRKEFGALEFARQMLCQARSDLATRFRSEWIERCKIRGNGRALCAALNALPKGYRTFTGVDLAIQQKDGADLTCLFTIAVWPDQSREILEIQSGRWTGPDIVARIINAHYRYHSIVIVENNAAQDFIVQFARGAAAIPIKGFTTGRNKAHPEFGIESLAAEMEAGRWVIPNTDGVCHSEIDAWIAEMLYYDPTAHTGDRLMASWFAREGVRMGAQKGSVSTWDTLSR